MLYFLIDQKIKDLNFNEIPKILHDSLTYQLLKELICKKFVDGSTFCDQHYLSRGTFQRRKKKLNELLSHFSLVFSKNVIQGDEKSLRWFLIQLLQSLAQFQLQKDIFSEDEWKLFKKCYRRLEKYLNHQLSDCFKSWILACFFSSLVENVQKNFYSDNESFTNFEMRGFHSAFHFFSKDKLQFLNLSYRLFYSEKFENSEKNILLHPKTIAISENLDKFLPFSLNSLQKQRISTKLTIYLNLQKYFPDVTYSFFIEHYQKNIHEIKPLKTEFYTLLQQELFRTNFLLTFQANSLFSYFFEHLICQQLLENDLPIYFIFHSKLDPFIEYTFKKKMLTRFPQLIESKTKNSADLKIIHSNQVREHKEEIFHFSPLETEKEWSQFAEQIEKIKYQKLIAFLRTKSNQKKIETEIK
ncbi:MAG: helix-turn-helix domain-containing protein [Lactobacillales bacterium]|jgi:hypothetical protein|nr:helix-turn-helix domain-containing protein [Lactobacillales bacterium]